MIIADPLALLYAPTGSARLTYCPALLARLVSWAAPPSPGERRPEGVSDGPASDDAVQSMTASTYAVQGKGRPRIPQALSTGAARARWGSLADTPNRPQLAAVGLPKWVLSHPSFDPERAPPDTFVPPWASHPFPEQAATLGAATARCWAYSSPWRQPVAECAMMMRKCSGCLVAI